MPTAFSWTVRVYYEDTDAGGIVYYANYLKFFERARTEWLRAAGIGQHALLEQHGLIFVVKQAQIDYHAPARLDDELKLTLRIEKLGRVSVTFVQEAWLGEQLLAEATVKVGSLAAASMRPCSLPAGVTDKMRAA